MSLYKSKNAVVAVYSQHSINSHLFVRANGNYRPDRIFSQSPHHDWRCDLYWRALVLVGRKNG